MINTNMPPAPAATAAAPAPTQHYGYDQGNPFGDPNKFTRSTGEDEINRFNEWLRAQPWWQNVKAQAGDGDMSDQQQQQIVTAAKQQGITVPHDFHIDEAGNFNQKSRTKRNLIIAAAIGGGVLTAGLASGAIGAGLGAGAAGASGGGAAATGGVLGSTAIGTGMVPAIAGGTGLASLGGGAAAAAGVGGAAGASGLTGAATTGSRLLGAAQAGSRMLGAFGEQQAQNRGSQAELALAGDQANLAANADNRTGETDALKKLAQSNYTLNHQIPALPTGARDFGFSQAPSDAQKTAAQQLQDEMQKRIASGGFHPQDYSQYGTPGTGERLAGLGSAALGIAGSYFGRR